jgi:hypothetical protein
VRIKIPKSEIPTPNDRGGMLWLFLGILPIPIGLMIGPTKIFNSFHGGNNGICAVYAGVVVACSLVCGIGQSGGFKSRKAADIGLGIVIGIFIGMVDFFVVFFVGCCGGFGNLGST